MKATAAWYVIGLALISLFCASLPAIADGGGGGGGGTGNGNGKGSGNGSGSAKPPAKPAPAKPAKPTDPPACSGVGMQRRCDGKCTDIQTDDRNCGSCGTICKTGYHCDGHLFCRDANGNL